MTIDDIDLLIQAMLHTDFLREPTSVARPAYFSDVTAEDVMRFERALGFREYERYCKGVVCPMDPDYRNLLRNLAGPNGYALWRAKQAKEQTT